MQLWAGSWANSNINTPSGYFTIASVFNSASGVVSLNGTAVSSLNTGGRNLSNGITIGANYLSTPTADFLGGNTRAEILIINSALDTLDRQKIEGYLANKWDW